MAFENTITEYDMDANSKQFVQGFPMYNNRFHGAFRRQGATIPSMRGQVATGWYKIQHFYTAFYGIFYKQATNPTIRESRLQRVFSRFKGGEFQGPPQA